MFDLKVHTTAVFTYKAVKHRYTFYLGQFWGSKCIENCKRNVVYKCNACLHVTHIQCSKIKLTVKPIVAHGLKADRLSSVRWKDILDVHCTDRVTLAAYRCIEEDNFDCKLQALPDLLIAF